MGEIFARPVASETLEFTGERLTSALSGETPIEHWHRYLLAREVARGRDILDIASGEGYGSALLAQTAKSVVGVDVSAEAVAHAMRAYTAPNLRYAVGDARQIPLPDSSVDLIVSFETLEHFAEHDQFLQEVKRVLRPNGALLISTPERDNYSPADQEPNPYHARELTETEFSSLLTDHFSSVSALGQRVMLGSVLVADASSNALLCFERRGAQHFEVSRGLPRMRYVVALATNDVSWTLPQSVYIDTSRLGYTDGPVLEQMREVVANCERRFAEATEMAASEKAAAISAVEERAASERAAAVRSVEEKTRAQLEALRRRAEALEVSCARAEAACKVAREQMTASGMGGDGKPDHQAAETVRLIAEQLRVELEAVRASTSWRVTAPLRALGRLLGRR